MIFTEQKQIAKRNNIIGFHFSHTVTVICWVLVTKYIFNITKKNFKLFQITLNLTMTFQTIFASWLIHLKWKAET